MGVIKRIYQRIADEAENRVSARRILAEKQFQYEHYEKVQKAHEMKAEGYSNAAIAREMHVSESTVRRMLKEPRV